MKKRFIFITLFASCILFAATAMAQQDTAPRENTEFFNGQDLTGWSGNDGYWSVKDGVILGHSDKNIARNEFIWSDVEVKDFYLALDVKLTPYNRNAGIQFRSRPLDAHGQAMGYQADVGHDQVIGNVWGNLYHEHGRGILGWNDRAVKVLNQGDVLKTFASCKCCPRHQTNKPRSLTKWEDLTTPETQWTNCNCSCRHLSRWICREVD